MVLTFLVFVKCSAGLCKGAGRRLPALLLGFLPTPICGPTPKACSNLFDVVVEPTSDLFSRLFDSLHDLVSHLSLLHSFLWGMHDRCLHFILYDRSPVRQVSSIGARIAALVRHLQWRVTNANSA